MGDVGTTKVFEDDRIVIWEFVLEPGEGDGPRVPATHSARNAGAGRYREILVEKKR